MSSASFDSTALPQPGDPNPNYTPPDPYTYTNHIPILGPYRESHERGSLLPLRGGKTGVDYCIFPVQEVRNAERLGWSAMRNARRFTITSSFGSMDMELMADSATRPVPGTDQNTSVRECTVHDSVPWILGLDPGTGFEFTPEAWGKWIKEHEGYETLEKRFGLSTASVNFMDLETSVEVVEDDKIPDLKDIGNFASQPVAKPVKDKKEV